MIVGIRIDGSKKTYYYQTNKPYVVGQRIKVKAPSGGTPDAVIVEIDVKKRITGLRELLEAE
ncbi:MAG: hypothetical protein ACLUVC_02315 [Longibaculum sp.]